MWNLKSKQNELLDTEIKLVVTRGKGGQLMGRCRMGTKFVRCSFCSLYRCWSIMLYSWSVYTFLKIGLIPIWSSNSVSGCHSALLKMLTGKYTHPHVCCSIIYYSQDIEATYASFNEWLMEEMQICVYMCVYRQWNMIQPLERNLAIYDNLGGPCLLSQMEKEISDEAFICEI